MSENLRDKLKDKKLVSGPYAPPAQPEAEQKHDGEDQTGRWQKFQVFALQLIWPGKGAAKEVRSILYDWISDDIEFQQEEDETGIIRLRYANAAGEFEVFIKGSQLDNLHNHLTEGRRLSIRETGAVREVTKPRAVKRDKEEE